jgi:hypothetical protein
MIAAMGGPLRYNKKARKRMRRFAKKVSAAADKLEAEYTNRTDVAVMLPSMAVSNLRLAKAHKKKKSKRCPVN